MTHASTTTAEGTQLMVLGGTVSDAEADELRVGLVSALMRTRPRLLVMELLPGVALDDTVVGTLRAAAGIANDLGIAFECRCDDPVLRAGIRGATPVPAPRANASTPGPGSPPPAHAINCSSAAS